MKLEDLKLSPRVRVKLFQNGDVCVIRYRIYGDMLIKETLSNSGEWLSLREGEASICLKNVLRQLQDNNDPAGGVLSPSTLPDA